MWRNVEVQGFTEWLRAWNAGKDPQGGKAVGFYGLDLYSLRRSMEAVVEYLEGVDTEMAEAVRERYGRMMVWAEDPHEYGLEALARGFKGCEDDVVKVLRDLLGKSKQPSRSCLQYEGSDRYLQGWSMPRRRGMAKNFMAGSRMRGWSRVGVSAMALASVVAD